MKQPISATICLTISLLLATACGQSDAAVAEPTASPIASPSPAFQMDPCNAANLPATIKPLNDLVRQFDDYASLAQYVSQPVVVNMIPRMQKIRRDAQDVAAPSCITTLKQLALSYMESVLQMLLTFGSTHPDAATLATSIVSARQYRQQYDSEIARLTGSTPPAPSATLPPGSPGQP